MCFLHVKQISVFVLLAMIQMLICICDIILMCSSQDFFSFIILLKQLSHLRACVCVGGGAVLLNISGRLSIWGQMSVGMKKKKLIRWNDDWNGLIYIFCMHTLHTWSLLSTGSSGQKSSICTRWTHLYANSLACRPALFLPFRTVYLLVLTDAKAFEMLKPRC